MFQQRLLSRISISTALVCLASISSQAFAVAPTVSLTAPAANARYSAPAAITLTASAANTGDTISKVEFYQGTTLLGTATTAPYSYNWSNVVTGSYSLTAKATNSHNETKTSTAVAVVVNNAPTVSLTAPANNSSVAGKATITLTANATDADGTISKVEFYNGTTLLNSDTAAPYSYSWTNVVPGTYSVTAKATDNLSGTTTSTPVSITVTNPITVNVTAPANNASVTVGTPIAITATAADSKGTISKVEFYNGTTLLGSATASPYSYSWTNAAVGTYSITAKVTDSQSLTQTSTPVSVQVKAAATTPPTVSLTPALKQTTQTAPANGTFVAPAGISLAATATPASGSTIAKVEFYQGATLIGTATAPTVTNGSNYSVNWTNVTANSYNVTAKATDNKNATATTAPVTVNVINNSAPTVSLTANPANATAPATIILNATATDSDGTIAQVEFLNGTNSIATVTQAPYTTNWANVAQGNYSLTAKATDNLGASTTSAAVPVAVTANTPKAYDIHADHLNTPRVITDATGTEVWRWDSAPFGETLPNEQPQGNQQTRFTFNQRFPGQYYDQETGLHHNYFRDYDPLSGRYLESDPIGLGGGINTYGYVSGKPLGYVDPSGLNPAIAGLCFVPGVGWVSCAAAAGTAIVVGGSYYVVKSIWEFLCAHSGNGNDTKGSGDVSSSGDKGKADTLQPGPHAGESIPARGPGRDFSKEERDKINQIGQDTGCHTCGKTDPGTKSGNFVPDHQPPNSLNPSGEAQKLYPHCLKCSRTQGGQSRGQQYGSGGT